MGCACSSAKQPGAGEADRGAPGHHKAGAQAGKPPDGGLPSPGSSVGSRLFAASGLLRSRGDSASLGTAPPTPTIGLPARVPPAAVVDPFQALLQAVSTCRTIAYIKGNAIGRGSSGVVYEGLVERTGAVIAVKEVHFRRSSEQQIAFLAREVRFLR